MKRTNILLTDKQHKLIKRYSLKEGITIFILKSCYSQQGYITSEKHQRKTTF